MSNIFEVFVANYENLKPSPKIQNMVFWKKKNRWMTHFHLHFHVVWSESSCETSDQWHLEPTSISLIIGEVIISNLLKIHFAPIFCLVTQSDHKFAHGMTALLSWHMQNCDLARSLSFKHNQLVFCKIWSRSSKICGLNLWADIHPSAAFIDLGQFDPWIKDQLGHDDVIKWKHFPGYWPFVWGIHQSLVNSPHKGPWMRSFDVFFDLRLV